MPAHNAAAAGIDAGEASPGADLPAQGTPQLRTLLLTDLCDSTELVERIGDAAAAELFRAHDKLVLDLQQHWRARLIDRSDGMLLLFERAIDGLGFALDYVRGLRDIGATRKLDLKARAGLHVGEVLTWRNSDAAVRLGAKPLEVEGLAKPMAARLMSLARPGQILLSAVAEPLAHRAARELGNRGEQLLWKSHGRWLFKGVPVAQEIFEVGEVGIAPLRPPRHTPKAWRDIPLWRRPAALVAEAAVLAGLVVGVWFATRPQPAIAFNERDWVVLGDLRNMTGDPRLDESLEQAFRISLEQSRYVNIVSDLKVRDTLARMQRAPDTAVDRAVGAEIALRDGARALILPTVSEVGGRLRVSAEVVDPQTQTTVHALSADGKGVDSALASIDKVTGELRGQLGEALQNIQKTSVPLPNVGTPSLDALKAYAIALHTMGTTRDRTATLGLYRRALQLDPRFALAHAGIGNMHAAFGNVADAKIAWRQALALPERLSPQEKLRLDLMLRQYDPPGPYFELADQYLQLYPDDYYVRRRVAGSRWHQTNDFAAAEREVRKTITPAAPSIASTHNALGLYLLGQERLGEAAATFRKARELGFAAADDSEARVHDVSRRHDLADQAMRRFRREEPLWPGESGVTTALDRGLWVQARAQAQTMLADAAAAKDPVETLRAQAAVASIAALSGAADAGAMVRKLAALADSSEKDVAGIVAHGPDEARLLAGLLGGLMDDRALVDEALRRTAASAAVRDYPTLAQLRIAVLGEQDRLAGKPRAAIARLSRLAARDDALVVVHLALMRAARAGGDTALANREAKWLATHRGRAFTENTTTDILRNVNIVATTEALLQAAELQRANGQVAESVQSLQAFLAAWPAAALPPAYARRVRGLE